MGLDKTFIPVVPPENVPRHKNKNNKKTLQKSIAFPLRSKSKDEYKYKIQRIIITKFFIKIFSIYKR